MAVLEAVDASDSDDLKIWFYKDIQALWEKLEARNK